MECKICKKEIEKDSLFTYFCKDCSGENKILEKQRQEILDKIEKFQKELLEIIDDCVNDWSYIERKYNEKFDELKKQLNQPKTEE